MAEAQLGSIETNGARRRDIYRPTLVGLAADVAVEPDAAA